jgi:CRP-like cAMP-binding protein
LACEPVVVRLAHLLAREAATDPEGEVHLTYQDMADMIGASHEEVGRQLPHLRHLGLVSSQWHRHGIVVPDSERLADYEQDSH